jgi:hypothetical protein
VSPGNYFVQSEKISEVFSAAHALSIARESRSIARLLRKAPRRAAGRPNRRESAQACFADFLSRMSLKF